MGGGTRPRFEERAPHERGFAAIWDAEIAPKLAGLERRRWLSIAGVPAILAGGVLPARALADLEWELIPSLMGIGALALAIQLILWFGRDKDRVLLSAVTRHVPGLEVAVGQSLTPDDIAPWRAAGLLPPPAQIETLDPFSQLKERIDVDDALRLRRRGITVWLGEAELWDRKGNNEETLFDGTLIDLRLPFGADAAAVLAAPGVTAALDALAGLVRATEAGRAASGDRILAALSHGGPARPLSAGGVFRSAWTCEPMVRSALAQLAQLEALTDAAADALSLPTDHETEGSTWAS